MCFGSFVKSNRHHCANVLTPRTRACKEKTSVAHQLQISRSSNMHSLSASGATMQKASLAEPLLQSAVVSEAVAGSKLELSVFRRSSSDFTVRSAEGDVRFLLHKRCHSLFGGLDWHLVNAVGDEYSNLLVRRSFASGETTFCTAQDDLTPARMTHKLGQLFSDVHWGSSTYRWEVTGPCTPVLLRLVNTSTRQCVAQLQASASLPWSKKQQKITVYTGLKDSLWLQVVVASGLAEAQRLGVGNSWTVPKRWAK